MEIHCHREIPYQPFEKPDANKTDRPGHCAHELPDAYAPESEF